MARREQRTLRICRLGRVEYEATAALQRGLRAAREAGAIDDVLLVLEHEPVITCGTRTQEEEVAFARTLDVPLVAVERGGKATYHGPGQVVVYPIIGIDIVDGDVPVLVEQLEGAIIETLAAHGVHADRRRGLPGVWVDPREERPRKVASLGLRLTKGVTFHGIAVNASCDLSPFISFSPCGIEDVEMTSLARELGLGDMQPDSDDGQLLTRSVAESLERRIVESFGYANASPIGADDLRLIAMRHEYEQPRVRLPWEPRQRDGAVPNPAPRAIDLSGKESAHA